MIQNHTIWIQLEDHSCALFRVARCLEDNVGGGRGGKVGVMNDKRSVSVPHQNHHSILVLRSL